VCMCVYVIVPDVYSYSDEWDLCLSMTPSEETILMEFASAFSPDDHSVSLVANHTSGLSWPLESYAYQVSSSDDDISSRHSISSSKETGRTPATISPPITSYSAASHKRDPYSPSRALHSPHGGAKPQLIKKTRL